MSTRQLGALAVILDRTCPDEEAWSRARDLATGGAGEATGHRELNRAVRSGLAHALREGLAGRDVRVDAWAFADVPGDGLSAFDGLEHPETAVQSLGAGPAEHLPGWLAAAGYAPGLDVWDPLEEALDQAVAALRADPGRRGAVLIVGNSPPQVLPAPGTPFAALARCAGFPTAVRRHSPLWDTALERCRTHGIPVIYVFLEHNVFRNDEERAHELFAEVARRVREGLVASLPAVVCAPASEEGTRRAVSEALALLASEDR